MSNKNGQPLVRHPPIRRPSSPDVTEESWRNINNQPGRASNRINDNANGPRAGTPVRIALSTRAIKVSTGYRFLILYANLSRLANWIERNARDLSPVDRGPWENVILEREGRQGIDEYTPLVKILRDRCHIYTFGEKFLFEARRAFESV